MANIDLGNLTRYDGKIKQYTEDKYLSKNTANWQMTNKAGAVTCYPVPDTELEPIVDFSFKEIPPISGDKSPNNPSTINGVMNINVGRCGKNLLVYPYRTNSILFSDLTITANNNGYVNFDGTKITTGRGAFSITNGTFDGGQNSVPCSVELVPGIQYTASLNLANGSISNTNDILLAIIDHDAGVYIATCGIGESVSFTPTHRHFRARLEPASGVVFSDVTVIPRLELSTDITSFELYSGADYTFSLDNTYYGGKVNLATGLMTVTWKGAILNGTEEWAAMDDINGWHPYYPVVENPAETYGRLSTDDLGVNRPMCTHASFTISYGGNINSTQFGMWGAAGRIILFSDKSMTDWKAWLAQQYANDTPVTVVWPTNNPFAVQLDPIRIKSLTALDKNTPRLNTLYTDADSIQVGYQKHPARTAYELENAILALGGGE